MRRRTSATLTVKSVFMARRPGAYAVGMPDLGSEPFVSLSTVKRDGTKVPTPVWLVSSAGRLYVWTAATSGKVKRIRNNRDVTLAPCTRRGTVTGPPVAARATIVSVDAHPEVWPVFEAKYGRTLRAILGFEKLVGLLPGRRDRSRSERIYIELEVTEGD
jgi:hypothetical protein